MALSLRLREGDWGVAVSGYKWMTAAPCELIPQPVDRYASGSQRHQGQLSIDSEPGGLQYAPPPLPGLVFSYPD